MASPLELRLSAQADASPDPDVRASLLAEIACYLARVGEFGESERLRKELRDVYGDGRCVGVSIQLMALDALLLYFKELSPSARDRMARANLIAIASGSLRWISLTSAWLAHIDFNLNRFESMAREITTTLDSISGDDGSAECRVSLVLGDAFLFCGKLVPSQRWYERARLTANRVGDQAAISALTYNRSALRVSNARSSAINAPPSSEEVARIWAEVRSASNYHIVANAKSLGHLLGSARVGVFVLQQNYELALKEIDAILATGTVPVGSGELVLLHADRALSLAAIGDRQAAVRQISVVSDSELDGLCPDDAALVSWSLSQAHSILDKNTDAAQLAAFSQAKLEQHQLIVDDLLAHISVHSDPGD